MPVAKVGCCNIAKSYHVLLSACKRVYLSEYGIISSALL
jgi:hypothetical protein